MTSLLSSILSVVVMTSFVLGNSANIFIAMVNCLDWVKSHKVSIVDGILTALAVSRIGMLWLILLNWCSTVLNPALVTSEVQMIIGNTWTVTNHFNLWFAAILSLFYLLKIASFSNLVFLHLKNRVKCVIVQIMLVNFVFLVCQLALLNIDLRIWKKELEGNVTRKVELRDAVKISHISLYTLLTFIPFVISLICFLLLACSLWKHLRNVRHHGQGFLPSSTKVHVKAMQTVVSFLLLFVIYFISFVISLWDFDTSLSKTVKMTCQAVGILYPANHSFILIWGSKKLKQTFLSVLWQMRCGVRGQTS